jgi:hypothetical protein
LDFISSLPNLFEIKNFVVVVVVVIVEKRVKKVKKEINSEDLRKDDTTKLGNPNLIGGEPMLPCSARRDKDQKSRRKRNLCAD